jgi:hypothetical protein
MQFLSKVTKHINLLAFASLIYLALAIPYLYPVKAQQPSQTMHAMANRQQAETGQMIRLSVANAFLRGTMDDLTCHLIGVNRTTPYQKCLIEDEKRGGLRPLTEKEIANARYQRGGIIAFSGGAINMLYTKPTDTNMYLASLFSNFGLAKKTFAQQHSPAANGDEVDCNTDPENLNCRSGTGYQSLIMIQGVFVLFRNIAYLLLVAAFALVGLGIMLRFHIDPRTVMTIQNQIPKAVIAILLITFSYSIAGLLIDAMWTTTYFGINLVANTDTSQCAPSDSNINNPNDGEHLLTPAGTATSGILNHPMQYTSDLFGNRSGCFGYFDGLQGLALHVGGAFADLVSRVFLTAVGGDEFIPPCGLGVPGSSGDFGGCVQTAIFQLVKFIVGILAVVVVLVAMIISLFRLWFMLLKNYIMLLLDIILGPIFILAGLIPGSSVSFTSWFRSIVAQLAVFPAAAILLVMAAVIASNPNVNDPDSNVFLPPLIGNPNIADGLGAIIAFGFILVAPSLLDTLRDALKAPASKQSGMVTAGIGFAAGRLGGGAKDTIERISSREKIELDRPGQPKRGLFRIPIIDKRIG